MRFKSSRWLILGLIAATGLALCAIAARNGGGLSLGMLLHGTVDSAAIMTLGTWNWLAFAGLQMIVSISGFLPASALGMAAGSIYGVGLGFCLSAASSLVGAGLAFALTRSVFRRWIEKQMCHRPRLHRIDAAIRRDGWRLACLVRLSPVMPFAATSYLLGLSGIGFRDYCIGTLGSLPALFGYVAIGAFAGAGVHAWTSGAGLVRLGLIFAGLLASGVATLRIGVVVAAAVNRRPTQSEAAEADVEDLKRSISAR